MYEIHCLACGWQETTETEELAEERRDRHMADECTGLRSGGSLYVAIYGHEGEADDMA